MTTLSTPNAAESAAPPERARRVLEFCGADLPPLSRRYDPLAEVNLVLTEGQCAVVLAPPGQQSLPLADAALGLAAPSAGQVRFLGDDWTRLGAGEQLARRALIGRVFDRAGWINNLKVLDNILLARRHHTALSEEQLLADAHCWARRFGLASVLAERPASVSDDQLRLAEWVRAFSLQPALLLLEHPMRGAPRERLASLQTAVAEAVARGAAVLWVASDAWGGAELAGPGALCYTVRDRGLVVENRDRGS